MGLLAHIFNSDRNIKKDRQKNRNFRICRIEEMETRDLLSVSPYDPPDPIDFGVVYHDDYSPTAPDTTEATMGDSFVVAWSGGAENTKLTQLTIDLSTAAVDLYFNTDPSAPQGDNGAAWDFQVSEDSDIKNCTFTLSEDGKSVLITFGEDFTADKVLKFTVDVSCRLQDGRIEPVVKGETFSKSHISAVFESADYHNSTIETEFVNTYSVPENLQILADDYGLPEESHRASTSGAVITGHEQIPLTGTISGFVYDDANNNGIKEEGEKGIADVELSLWVWDSELEQYVDTGKTVTTDANGQYAFNDVEAFQKYQIREVQPEGYEDGKESVGTMNGINAGTLPEVDNDTIGDIWMAANGTGENYNFGEYKNGSISGHVVDDEGNPIPDVVIKIYDEDGNKIGETTTDEHGRYRFDKLPPGNYWVKQYQPEGYCGGGVKHIGRLGGEEGKGGGYNEIGDITINSGDRGRRYDFYADRTGTISGYVYVDVNKNGVKDEGEQGIEGVYLTLWVWNGTQYIQTSKEAYTNANGYYTFTGLCAGNKYQVRETQPEDYNQGTNTIGSLGGDFMEDVDVIGEISMPPGGRGENYNFGELEKEPPVVLEKGSISGHVYLDENKNGSRDAGEFGIGNVTIILEKMVEGKYVFIAETTTNSSGYYIFSDIDPNETYRVHEIKPDGYDDGGITVGSLGGEKFGEDSIQGILVGENQHGENYDFGKIRPNIPPPPPEPESGSISGYVYLDENKDGIRNEGELGIGNVMMLLEKLVDGKYVFITYTFTNSNGYYVFNNLDPNETYRIVEVQPAGYDQGKNSIGSLGGLISGDIISNIQLSEGDFGTNYNFGEWIVTPPTPPSNPPSPPVLSGSPSTPPYFVPQRPVGAMGQPFAAAAPSWQMPYLAESLHAGFGGGGEVVGANGAYSWHLSVVNAGYPRSNGLTDGIAVNELASQTTMILSDSDGSSVTGGARYVSVAWTPLPMNQSGWYVRGKDGIVRKRFTFGPDGGIPVVGDFSGDGIDNIAVYHEGNWYIDINGNGKWDEEDLWAQMGGQSDQPVVGDWDGDGKIDIGVFGPMWSGDQQVLATKSGLPTDLNSTVSSKPKNVPPDIAINVSMNNVRAMKHSESGGVRLDVVDHVFQYGNEGDKAFTGDFSGDGIATIGVYRNGKWYIDRTGTGKWDENAVFVDNADFGLGSEGIPVIGDFSGDGIDKIGLYMDGVWYLDTTGDFKFDTRIEFGQSGDYPVVGDFDGSGIAKLAVYRASTEESLYASNVPEAAPATGKGMVARQYAGDDQVTDGEVLKHHGRSVSTPHTNAPLLRGR